MTIHRATPQATKEIESLYRHLSPETRRDIADAIANLPGATLRDLAASDLDVPEVCAGFGIFQSVFSAELKGRRDGHA